MNTIAIVLFAIVACASAAPRYHNRNCHHHPFPHDADLSLERFIDREIFDTRSFWEELRRDMMDLDGMIAALNRNFPTFVANEKTEGNKYKISIMLNGFEEKEIAVKAKKRLLIVQAVHKVEGEPERNYVDLRTLPDFVDINGSWTFENGVLTVVFPLERSVEGTEATITEAPVTQSPEHSREEIESNPTGQENLDVDIGNERGDLGKDKNISTNEIPSGQQSAVEATTYAVDLKDEVELLPIHRNVY